MNPIKQFVSMTLSVVEPELEKYSFAGRPYGIWAKSAEKDPVGALQKFRSSYQEMYGNSKFGNLLESHIIPDSVQVKFLIVNYLINGDADIGLEPVYEDDISLIAESIEGTGGQIYELSSVDMARSLMSQFAPRRKLLIEYVDTLDELREYLQHSVTGPEASTAEIVVAKEKGIQLFFSVAEILGLPKESFNKKTNNFEVEGAAVPLKYVAGIFLDGKFRRTIGLLLANGGKFDIKAMPKAREVIEAARQAWYAKHPHLPEPTREEIAQEAAKTKNEPTNVLRYPGLASPPVFSTMAPAGDIEHEEYKDPEHVKFLRQLEEGGEYAFAGQSYEDWMRLTGIYDRIFGHYGDTRTTIVKAGSEEEAQAQIKEKYGKRGRDVTVRTEPGEKPGEYKTIATISDLSVAGIVISGDETGIDEMQVEKLALAKARQLVDVPEVMIEKWENVHADSPQEAIRIAEIELSELYNYVDEDGNSIETKFEVDSNPQKAGDRYWRVTYRVQETRSPYLIGTLKNEYISMLDISGDAKANLVGKPDRPGRAELINQPIYMNISEDGWEIKFPIREARIVDGEKNIYAVFENEKSASKAEVRTAIDQLVENPELAVEDVAEKNLEFKTALNRDPMLKRMLEDNSLRGYIKTVGIDWVKMYVDSVNALTVFRAELRREILVVKHMLGEVDKVMTSDEPTPEQTRHLSYIMWKELGEPPNKYFGYEKYEVDYERKFRVRRRPHQSWHMEAGESEEAFRNRTNKYYEEAGDKVEKDKIDFEEYIKRETQDIQRHLQTRLSRLGTIIMATQYIVPEESYTDLPTRLFPYDPDVKKTRVLIERFVTLVANLIGNYILARNKETRVLFPTTFRLDPETASKSDREFRQIRKMSGKETELKGKEGSQTRAAKEGGKYDRPVISQELIDAREEMQKIEDDINSKLAKKLEGYEPHEKEVVAPGIVDDLKEGNPRWQELDKLIRKLEASSKPVEFDIPERIANLKNRAQLSDDKTEIVSTTDKSYYLCSCGAVVPLDVAQDEDIDKDLRDMHVSEHGLTDTVIGTWEDYMGDALDYIDEAIKKQWPMPVLDTAVINQPESEPDIPSIGTETPDISWPVFPERRQDQDDLQEFLELLGEYLVDARSLYQAHSPSYKPQIRKKRRSVGGAGGITPIQQTLQAIDAWVDNKISPPEGEEFDHEAVKEERRKVKSDLRTQFKAWLGSIQEWAIYYDGVKKAKTQAGSNIEALQRWYNQEMPDGRKMNAVGGGEGQLSDEDPSDEEMKNLVSDFWFIFNPDSNPVHQARAMLARRQMADSYPVLYSGSNIDQLATVGEQERQQRKVGITDERSLLDLIQEIIAWAQLEGKAELEGRRIIYTDEEGNEKSADELVRELETGFRQQHEPGFDKAGPQWRESTPIEKSDDEEEQLENIAAFARRFISGKGKTWAEVDDDFVGDWLDGLKNIFPSLAKEIERKEILGREIEAGDVDLEATPHYGAEEEIIASAEEMESVIRQPRKRFNNNIKSDDILSIAGQMTDDPDVFND